MDSRSESAVDVMMMIYYVDSTINILRAALMIYSPALSAFGSKHANSSHETRTVCDLREIQNPTIDKELIGAANTPLAWIE